jgi:hypothetical protein
MANTKLLTAAEEIKDILRKHDIAASIALHTPGHGEYLIHFTTSYSCVYMYEDDQVRIRSKREDYATAEEQFLAQQNTSNMLKILKDTTAINFQHLSMLSDKLDKQTGAVHTKGEDDGC